MQREDLIRRSPLRTRKAASRRARARLGPLASARAARAAIATGRDLSAPEPRRERRALSRRAWLACAAGGLVAALVLVQLRTESIDLRYRLAHSLQVEHELLEQKRRLVVERRQLRHPVRLAGLGTQLGLMRPSEVRELDAAH